MGRIVMRLVELATVFVNGNCVIGSAHDATMCNVMVS